MPIVAIIEYDCRFRPSRPLLDKLGVSTQDDVNNTLFGIVDANVYAFRAHPDFLKALLEVGLDNALESRDGGYPNPMKLIEIPYGLRWEITINRYDEEYVTEPHRIWR